MMKPIKLSLLSAIECFYYLHEYGFQNHHDNEISIVEVGSFQ